MYFVYTCDADSFWMQLYALTGYYQMKERVRCVSWRSSQHKWHHSRIVVRKSILACVMYISFPINDFIVAEIEHIIYVYQYAELVLVCKQKISSSLMVLTQTTHSNAIPFSTSLTQTRISAFDFTSPLIHLSLVSVRASHRKSLHQPSK